MENSALHIAFLINITLDRGNSGPSVHLLYEMIRASAEAGARVSILSKYSEEADNADYSELCASYGIEHYKVRCSAPPKSSTVKRFLKDHEYFKRSYETLRKINAVDNVDVVFIQSCISPLSAVSFAKKACKGARIVYNVQDIYPEAALCRGMVKKSDFAYRLVRRLQEKAYRACDEVITISEDMKKTILESGIDEARVSVLHNWAYNDKIVEIEESENQFAGLCLEGKSLFRVVYAGNVGALQDVETLVEAAALLRNDPRFHFYIVGDGVKADSVRDRVKELGLANVSLLPRQSQSMAPHVYSFADVNIISLVKGLTRAALPSKTAICLSCGKPIVLSTDLDSSYAAMMKSTGNCEVCPPQDALALRDAIVKVFDNRNSYNADGARALFANTFSKERNARAYAKLLTNR